MIDFKNLDIQKTHQLLKNGEIKVQDLVDYYLKNIQEKNDQLKAYIQIFDDIQEQIKEAQERIDKGEADILTGIPIAIKANILIKGKEANASSKILENYKGTFDATVVEKLKKQNPIFIGYTNMDEFACGGSTETSAYGITRNALNPETIPGGSSGGSAVAVASEMALVSLGTDTGGSIRQPASFNGIVGFKGSYGSVSRFGAIAMGSSLDQIGPLGKNVQDVEILFKAIKGKDEKDMTSFDIDEKIKEIKKIGIIPEMMEDLDSEIKEIYQKNLEKLKEKGYEIKEISFPELKYSLPVYYTLMPAEVSSNLARFDGIRYGNKIDGKDLNDIYFQTRANGFGDEVKRRILLGTYVLSAGYADKYYVKALTLREKIKTEFQKIMEEVDVIFLPTSPKIPRKIGSSNSPLEEYLADIYTVSANIIGCPAISIPTEEKIQDFPLGMQFLAKTGNDLSLLDFAKKIY